MVGTYRYDDDGSLEVITENGNVIRGMNVSEDQLKSAGYRNDDAPAPAPPQEYNPDYVFPDSRDKYSVKDLRQEYLQGMMAKPGMQESMPKAAMPVAYEDSRTPLAPGKPSIGTLYNKGADETELDRYRAREIASKYMAKNDAGGAGRPATFNPSTIGLPPAAQAGGMVPNVVSKAEPPKPSTKEPEKTESKSSDTTPLEDYGVQQGGDGRLTPWNPYGKKKKGGTGRAGINYAIQTEQGIDLRTPRVLRAIQQFKTINGEPPKVENLSEEELNDEAEGIRASYFARGEMPPQEFELKQEAYEARLAKKQEYENNLKQAISDAWMEPISPHLQFMAELEGNKEALKSDYASVIQAQDNEILQRQQNLKEAQDKRKAIDQQVRDQKSKVEVLKSEADSMLLDPDRYTKNMSVAAKIIALVGAFAAGYQGGLTGRGGNSFLDNFNTQIQQDIDSQKFEIARAEKRGDKAENEYQRLLDRFGTPEEAEQAFRLERLAIANGYIKNKLTSADFKHKEQEISQLQYVVGTEMQNIENQLLEAASDRVTLRESGVKAAGGSSAGGGVGGAVGGGSTATKTDFTIPTREQIEKEMGQSIDDNQYQEALEKKAREAGLDDYATATAKSKSQLSVNGYAEYLQKQAQKFSGTVDKNQIGNGKVNVGNGKVFDLENFRLTHGDEAYQKAKNLQINLPGGIRAWTANAEDAKQVRAAIDNTRKTFSKIAELRRAREEMGASVPATADRARLKSIYAQLQGQIKEAEALGAWDNGTAKLTDRYLGGVDQIFAPGWEGAINSIVTSLNNAISSKFQSYLYRDPLGYEAY